MAESDNESGGHKEINNSNKNNQESSQDILLPIANVSRIMKKGLPANAKISKDAKETVQECVSEFISFITGEASDKCLREKRKTINGDDLLWAMTTLGFEDYVEPLKVYSQRFRDMEGEKCAMAGGKESDNGSGSVVNIVNSGVGYAGNYGGSAGLYGVSSGTGYQQPQSHQGHVYGIGVCGQMGVGGPGKVRSGYVGSGTQAPGRSRWTRSGCA